MPPDVKKDQDEIERRLNKLEQELVNPDDGVYARITSLSSEMKLNFADIKYSLSQLLIFKQDIDKSAAAQKIVDIERRLGDVEKWKTSLVSATIWLTTVLLTGTVGLGFKILYDVFSRKLNFL